MAQENPQPQNPVEPATVVVENPNAIVVNVPNSADEIQRQENLQRWYFQKFSDWAQEHEARISSIINNNKFWLIFSYTLLFLVAVARIAIYFFVAKFYDKEFISGDRTMIVIEASLSLIWVGYFLNQFISKLRLTYIENVRWTSLMYVLFCVQYFSLSYWVIETVFEYTPKGFGISIVVLFVIYGFISEKSPNTLALTVYCILMIFIFELIIRILTCQCYNPWNEPEPAQFVRKELGIINYSSATSSQKNCGICLKEFIDNEKVCPLSCHPTHVFHSECLKEWLNRNYFCPFCRAVVTASNN